MSITLKHNDKPNFPKVKFDCDNPIHKKLDKYELTKSFLNESNVMLIIGKPKSGKTSLTVNFVEIIYKKVFHHIYVFMPATSRRSLHNNIFDKHLDPSQIYDELNSVTMKDLEDKLEANSKKNEWSLVIYDDVQKSLKDKNVEKSFNKLIANHRHLRVTNIILLQNFKKVPKDMRSIVNNIVLFKLAKTQMYDIFEELIEVDKQYFDDIRKLVYDKPNSWLFINLPTQRIFKGFDEILLDDESDSDSDYDSEDD